MPRRACIRVSKTGTSSGATANTHPFDDFLGAPLEPANALAAHAAESLQQTPDLVLQPDADADERIVALDLDGLEPASTHDLSKAPGVMPVCLVRHHFQHTIDAQGGAGEHSVQIALLSAHREFRIGVPDHP